MRDAPCEFDPDSIQSSRHQAADAYAAGQASGRDDWQYEFLGPAQGGHGRHPQKNRSRRLRHSCVLLSAVAPLCCR